MAKKNYLYEGSITQEIQSYVVSGAQYSLYGGGYNKEGCLAFLNRHSKGIKDYLCNCIKYGKESFKRLVMIVPEKGFTDARGIYLALGNTLEDGFLCKGREGEPASLTSCIEYHRIDSEKETESSNTNREVAFSIPVAGNLLGGNILPKFNKVFFDARYTVLNEDNIETIMKCDAEFIVVCVTDAPENTKAIQTLQFEMDYKVLELESEKDENLTECAKEYCKSCGYKYEDADLERVVNDLQQLRSGELTEKEVCVHLAKCIDQKRKITRSKKLNSEDVAVRYYGFGKERKARRIVGREVEKAYVMRAANAMKLMEDSPISLSHHMIFAGDPGTCKTEMARWMADMLYKNGVSNGKFLEATRAALIGKYVGHTAKQIEKIFETAKGGVLFIDEAGFLLQNDTYVRDAVTELVRFMEMYPETTVIFATYPEEAEKLRHIDPGFASRISRVIRFEPYTDQELCNILSAMAEDYGFDLEDGYKESFMSFIREAKAKKGFGNGRTVRKLLETAIEEAGMRSNGCKTKLITVADIDKAVKLLGDESACKKIYGFTTK